MRRWTAHNMKSNASSMKRPADRAFRPSRRKKNRSSSRAARADQDYWSRKSQGWQLSALIFCAPQAPDDHRHAEDHGDRDGDEQEADDAFLNGGAGEALCGNRHHRRACAPQSAEENTQPVSEGGIDDKPEGDERGAGAERKAVPEEAEHSEEGAVHQPFEMRGDTHARIFECAGYKAGQQPD